MSGAHTQPMPLTDMPASTFAGTIAAIGSIGTMIALVINALAAWRRSNRVEGKVDQVHIIVNQQRTDAANYQRALIRALKDAGVAVPADQSIDAGD